MSRFDAWDGEIVPPGLWEHNVAQALAGKRGQKALREIRDALLALPRKRLIAGALCDGVDFCAVGAWSFRRRVAAGQQPSDVLEQLSTEWDGDPDDTCHEAQRLGVAWCLAWELAARNDELGHSPEERYEKYLAWVESRIVARPGARTPAP